MEKVQRLHNLERKSDIDANSALEYYKFILDTFLELPGYKEPHPTSANVLKHYGLHMINVKQYELAGKTLRLSCEMYEQSSKNDWLSMDLAGALSFLAMCQWKSGDIAKAISTYTQSLELLMPVSGKAALLNLAEIEKQLGELYQSENEADRARHHLLAARTNFLLAWGSDAHPMSLEVEEMLHSLPSL